MEYFFHYAIPSPHDMGQECDTQKNKDHVKGPGKQEKQVPCCWELFSCSRFSNSSRYSRAWGRGAGVGSLFLNFCSSNRREFTQVN